jgi:hypothetical protein
MAKPARVTAWQVRQAWAASGLKRHHPFGASSEAECDKKSMH